MTPFIIFIAKYLVALPVLIAAGYALVTRRRREFLIFAALVLVTSYLLALVAGHFYYNPRPFVVLNTAPLVAHPADNGFPSEHMLLASTLAAIVTPFSLPLGIVMWIIALFVGAGRVLALVHHSIDIVASFFIAIVSALVMWRVHFLFQRASTRRGA